MCSYKLFFCLLLLFFVPYSVFGEDKADDNSNDKNVLKKEVSFLEKIFPFGKEFDFSKFKFDASVSNKKANDITNKNGDLTEKEGVEDKNEHNSKLNICNNQSKESPCESNLVSCDTKIKEENCEEKTENKNDQMNQDCATTCEDKE